MTTRALCCVARCDRLADVEVVGRIGGAIYYCRKHAKRWSDPACVPQPAMARVLAGRFWDADRKSGAKRRKH